jgi:hypothetical protein
LDFRSLHVTAGTKDTFYLDAATHRMQDYLESTKLPGKGPYYAGSFDFGIDKPHCYLGDIPQGVPMLPTTSASLAITFATRHPRVPIWPGVNDHPLRLMPYGVRKSTIFPNRDAHHALTAKHRGSGSMPEPKQSI